LKRVEIKVPDEEAEQFERFVQEHSSTMTDFLIDAGKHFLLCGKTPELRGMKKMQAPIEGTCAKCGAKIKPSQTVYYSPEQGIICLACHDEIELDALNDPLVLKKRLILRGLDTQIPQARKLLNALLDEINRITAQIDRPDLEKLIAKAYAARIEAHELITSFLRQCGTTNDREAAATFEKLNAKLETVIQELKQEAKRKVFDPTAIKKIKEMVNVDGTTFQLLPAVKVGEKPSETDDTEKFLNDPDAQTKIKDPNNTEFSKAGMIYCYEDSIWVKPTKCTACKTDFPSKYNDCQEAKTKEQEDQSTT